MEDSFAKVMSLAAFIVLGHLLRRFNILKDQAFAAISALVMNVTLPCVILTNLNGVKIEGDMLLIAGLGLLTNIIFLVWGLFLSRNIADTQWRDFVRLNVGGIVGALLTGVFASSAVTGSEMNPVMTQVGIQAASVVATMVYASAVSWILLKIIDVVMGLRVTSDEERMGLDLSLHGERIE